MTCPRTFKPVLSVIRFERQLSLLESGKQNIFHGHFYTPTCRPLKAPVVWAFKAHFAQCSSRRHSCLTNVQQCDVRGRGRESLSGRPPGAPPFAPRGYPNARAPSSVRPSLAVAEGPPDLRVRDSAESAKGRTETDGVTSLWQDFLVWVEKE